MAFIQYFSQAKSESLENSFAPLLENYGMIIPKEFLSLSKEGFINLHASILPKWRGAAPIQRSIMNKDKETGISVMKINEKLDEGDISHIFKIDIEENENAQSLSDRLSILASEKILKSKRGSPKKSS